GMATLLVGVIFFFPAALSYLGARESRAPAPSIRLPVAALLRAYDAAASRRRGVLLAIGALTAAMLVAAPGVRVSTDLRSIRGDDPAAAGMARVLAPFAAAGAAESMVVTGGDAGTLEAFCREAIAAGRIAACGRAEAGVPSAPVQRERFEKISLLPWEAAVATLEDEARAAGMNEEFFAPFTGAALRYADFESVAIAPGTDRPRLPSTTLFFEEQASAAGLAADLRARAGDVRIASIALVASDLSRVLAEDFRRAAAIVAVVIAAMMLAAFRRVRASAVTLLPVAIGTIWMLGTARLLGVELNLMSLMGMPVVFGLGVDFGVYLVDRWRTEGGDARAALAGAGPAVLVTGLTTLAGFAALLAADLAGLRSLGFTVVAGAGYSLLAALIVVPLLLPGVERPPPRG
ncbi:MAG TPA: MMPL family transporter, partial [Verrucomicrobiae bacterium]|nr:MMPL family transporter [Verrucomicrobiae bacterium]